MRSFIMLLSAFAILGGLSAFQAIATELNSREQTIIRNEEQVSIRGTDKIFTGNARIDRIYPANNKMRSNGSSITFEPGARTHWHIHPVGQVLIVTSGLGLTQEWGKPIQEIRPGDVIICPAGIKHWHGASANKSMTHIEINEADEAGKIVEWMEPVSDEQYRRPQ